MKRIFVGCILAIFALIACDQTPTAPPALTLDASTIQEISAPLEAVNEVIADTLKDPTAPFTLPKVNLPGDLKFASASFSASRATRAITTVISGDTSDTDSDGIPADQTTTYGGNDAGLIASGSSNLKDKGNGNLGFTSSNTNLRFEKGTTFFMLNSNSDFTPLSNGLKFGLNFKFDVGYNGKTGSLEFKLDSSYLTDATGGTLNYTMTMTVVWDGKTSTLSATGENLHFSKDCAYSFDAGKTTYTGANGQTIEHTYNGCARATPKTPVLDSLSIAPVNSSVEVGKTLQYSVEARDTNNNVMSGLSYTYSSSDTGKATIDANGLASGVAQGTTTITAQTNGRSVSTGLTVNPAATTNFTAALSKTSATVSKPKAGLSIYADFGGLTITRNGYSGGLTLSLENAPVGVTPVPNNLLATANTGDFGLQVTDATPVGTYSTIKLVVAGGGLERRIDLSLTVNAAASPRQWRSVSTGVNYSCGISTTGAAYCWGSNRYAQLGSGDKNTPNVPVPVAVSAPSGGSVLNFSSISAKDQHTCGITATLPGIAGGVAYCWGSNEYGKSGNSSLSYEFAPVAVSAPSGGAVLSFSSISAGSNHTCAITTAGAAYCWGYNGNGELGISNYASSSLPVAVTAPSGGTTLNFSSISAGLGYTCAITTAGAAYCWGLNNSGQLGNGSTNSPNLPVAVAAPSGGTTLNFSSISVGINHTCANTKAGAAYCWGNNSVGKLGNGTTTDSSLPVAVAGTLSFSSLSASPSNTCGVTTTGAAYCWGLNSIGQLGNGTTTNSSSPLAVAAPSGGNVLTFSKVAAGGLSTCGLTTSGAVYCWGYNDLGQLGNNSTTNANVPVVVAAIP